MSDYAARFVSGLVGSPEDRFSDVAAQIGQQSIIMLMTNGRPNNRNLAK